jgi:hypothetical protein
MSKGVPLRSGGAGRFAPSGGVAALRGESGEATVLLDSSTPRLLASGETP